MLPETPWCCADSLRPSIAVGGVYRNPDSVAECNRGRISSPELDFVPPTGREAQEVGRKGSFPLDCSEIAVKLHLDCGFDWVVPGRGGVADTSWTRAACVPGNRRGRVG